MVMEASEKEGLIVSFDDESSTFSFEWDENTHPEYNYLKDLTSEKFSQILKDYLSHYTEHPDDQTNSVLSSWGSSGGTSKVDDHPEPKS